VTTRDGVDEIDEREEREDDVDEIEERYKREGVMAMMRSTSGRQVRIEQKC
jgi:hypothetical protein